MLFLYREVLGLDLPWMQDMVRAKRPARLPVVLTQREVVSVLDRMEGTHGLMARMLYGTGMRLMEVVRLRVKDVDFERSEVMVRDGKGARVTMLPQTLHELLKAHLQRRRCLFDDDLAMGKGDVFGCTGTQISRCTYTMGVAICVPIGQLFGGSSQWGGASPSHG